MPAGWQASPRAGGVCMRPFNHAVQQRAQALRKQAKATGRIWREASCSMVACTRPPLAVKCSTMDECNTDVCGGDKGVCLAMYVLGHAPAACMHSMPGQMQQPKPAQLLLQRAAG